MQTITKSYIPAALLILLFSYAAASKLSDFETFRGQLYLQPFSHRFSDGLVYLLPAIELLTVGLLLFDRSRSAGLIVSVSLLAVFTIYISMGLLHFWKRVPCSCGGILGRMGRGTHLAFNWAFIIINILAIIFRRREKEQLT